MTVNTVALLLSMMFIAQNKPALPLGMDLPDEAFSEPGRIRTVSREIPVEQKALDVKLVLNSG